MKKLLCLLMAVALVLSFAACGGNGTASSSDSGTNTPAGATKITFDAANYTVGIDEYIMLSEHITVEPAGAKVVYTSSDTAVAELSTPSKGEFAGVKTGTAIITAASEDGKVTATCTLNVVGIGTVVALYNDVGGITNKRWGEVERPNDTDAFILIIPKNLTGADMSKAVAMDAGDELSDGSHAVAYGGYFIAKTNTFGNYTLKNVPEGDYVGIIVSSMDYTRYKEYSESAALATFKASAIASFFTDAEASQLVSKFYQREFFVGELTVKANEVTVFGNLFQPDLDNAK